MALKRYKIILYIFTICFFLLLARVCFITFISGDKLSQSADSQRKVSEELQIPRGDILDKNMIHFTDRNEQIQVVVKPNLSDQAEQQLQSLCSLAGQDFVEVKRELEFNNEPVIIKVNEPELCQIKNLDTKNFSVIHSTARYDDSTLASHIIGYIGKSDSLGKTGIEKAFDKTLRMNGDYSVSFIRDARHNVLEGLGYRLIKPKDEKKDVKLTLDYHIQKAVENVMDKNKIKGAVVVEDVRNGDILAMASKPDYNPLEVDKYLNSTDNELFNRAVASYSLGSVFKIIDSAYFIENNADTSELYFCSGKLQIGNQEFRCSSFDKGGHGWVDFYGAFSKSCNTYFMNMALKTGIAGIINMAKKFGLGSTVGLQNQGIYESSGRLPSKVDNLNSGTIANLSIGQGEILATPVQVADLVATVANDGIKNKVNLVDGIYDEKGNCIQNIKQTGTERVISQYTASKLQKMMHDVTVNGTGLQAKLEDIGGAAGKTGSAETGQIVNGQKVTQAWFAGYFPYDNPKYSICVFIENGKAGGTAAAPIFAEIAKSLHTMGY